METLQPVESGDIDHLLHSVLIPTFPPNRSQWRKLENALKFINNSKQSANTTKQNRLEEAKTAKKQENAMERRKLLQLEEMASEAFDSSLKHHSDMKN